MHEAIFGICDYVLGELEVLHHLIDELHSCSAVAVWSAVLGPIVGAVAGALGTAAAAVRLGRRRGASVNMARWISGVLGGCGGAVVATAAVRGYWTRPYAALSDWADSACLLMLTTAVAGSVFGCAGGVLVTVVPWLRRRGRLTKAQILGVVLSAVAGAIIGWCGAWLYLEFRLQGLDTWLLHKRFT